MKKNAAITVFFIILALVTASAFLGGCQKVSFIPGASYGYYIWEEDGRLHISWSIDRKDAGFSGTITTDGTIDYIETLGWEEEDSWELEGSTLSYESTLGPDDYTDGLVLDISGYTYIEIDPEINGGHDLSRVHVGAFLNNPEDSPFRISPGYFEEVRDMPWYERHPFSGFFYKLYANKYFTFAFLFILGVVVIELLRITAFSRSMRRRLYTAISYIVLVILEIAAYLIIRSFVL